ncbi:unnamed protein product [Linum tenue]|uniref:Uncharacterized protein n=1 Tax=Linum tenue TaxID=586396 RepID=A0AAV0HTV7_9ROSI|nr:unnamed protein product [Linum tenue]
MTTSFMERFQYHFAWRIQS